MRIRGVSILSLVAVVACLGTHAATPSNVEALFAKARDAGQPPITFSDGTTTWDGGSLVYRLASGRAVIVKAKKLELDTAGAPSDIRACDEKQHEGGTPFTALAPPGQLGADSNATPYIVLPHCNHPASTKCLAKPSNVQLGLHKGDVAAVISGDKIVFAIAAEYGQEKKFGEGSIELHRNLGHEVIGARRATPRCAANEGLDQDTYIVVFPHSNARWLTNAQIKSLGQEKWKALLADEKLVPSGPP